MVIKLNLKSNDYFRFVSGLCVGCFLYEFDGFLVDATWQYFVVSVLTVITAYICSNTRNKNTINKRIKIFIKGNFEAAIIQNQSYLFRARTV